MHSDSRQTAESGTCYNMVTVADDGDLMVHRPVQAVIRGPDPADPDRSPAVVDRARAVRAGSQATAATGKPVRSASRFRTARCRAW